MNKRKKTRASIFTQTNVYISKNFRIFMNQKDWKFIVIAAVISFLVCWIVGDKMFVNYEGTKSGFFAIISAAIWIGIFNSIQGICKEHNTITSEYRAGLHLSSYIFSHVIFQFFLCLIQAILLMVISIIFIDYPKDGIIFPNSIPEYFITLFLIIWGSAVMGIMISSVSPEPNVAMTAMPFVLILQLVMSGVLFELSGLSEKIAYITFSKWGMAAIGSIGDLNSDSLPYKLEEVVGMPLARAAEDAYERTSGNLLCSWGCILIILAVCILVAILSLKIKNRKS